MGIIITIDRKGHTEKYWVTWWTHQRCICRLQWIHRFNYQWVTRQSLTYQYRNGEVVCQNVNGEVIVETSLPAGNNPRVTVKLRFGPREFKIWWPIHSAIFLVQMGIERAVAEWRTWILYPLICSSNCWKIHCSQIFIKEDIDIFTSIWNQS
jgi:hypothetical protein